MKYVLLSFIMFIVSACAPVRIDPQRQIEARKFVDTGVLYLRAGELEKAQSAFELAAETAQLPETFDGLGCVAFMMGDMKAAQKLFLKAYDVDNEYAQALEHLALVYDYQGFTKESDELYLRALEKDPSLFRAHNNRAALLYDHKIGDKREIKSELVKAAVLVNAPEIENNLKKMQ